MGNRSLRAFVFLNAILASLPAVADSSGRGTYSRHCAPCHGVLGDGNGPQARFLSVKPRDLTVGQLHFRSGAAGAPPTLADYERTIRRGVPSTAMPSWEGILSEGQIREVASYSRSLATTSSIATPPVTIPDAPEADATESAARGRAAFLLVGCWACHGPEGHGDGPATVSPLIRPTDFTTGDFRSGGTPGDLYRTILTGMAGVPMPAFGKNLFLTRESASVAPVRDLVSTEDLAALTRFVASLPSTEEWDALPEPSRESFSTAMRWDLVQYLGALGSRGALTRYLFDDPYVTH
ncbi:MAG: c-type cytochrome [Deltaproteobacteria bacterium]|nr:c-type cytochrome [Deltaproteobacteria bacterium]